MILEALFDNKIFTFGFDKYINIYHEAFSVLKWFESSVSINKEFWLISVSNSSCLGEGESLWHEDGDRLDTSGESGGEFWHSDLAEGDDSDNGLGLRFASSFFHFILLFWNQILICLSVKFNMAASSILRGREIYLLKWNSFSSSRSWPRVYAVLVLLLSSSMGKWAPLKENNFLIVRMWFYISFRLIFN